MMNVSVWGCRGSLPSPGPEKNIYGGNTACVQVTQGDTCIILDGGSGIQRLGQFMTGHFKEIHILLSHLHLDHTMGLGFFLPLYDPNVRIHLWGPTSGGKTLLQRLRRYFSPPLFPVRLNELPAHPEVHEISDSEFEIDDIAITSRYICHPGPTLGYRLESGNAVLAYIPDHEVFLGSHDFPNDPEWTSGYSIARDADLLFHDAQYSQQEYEGRVGWGHSSLDQTIAFAKMCNVKELALFHHDPARTDEQLTATINAIRENHQGDFELRMCAEEDTFELGTSVGSPS